MMYESNIAIPAGLEWLVLIGLLGIGGAAWVLSGWRAGRVLAAVVGCLLALVVVAQLLALGLARIRTSASPIPAQHSLSLVPELDTSAPISSAAWLEASDYFLDADVYPSDEAAVSASTKLLLRRVVDIAPDRKRPAKVGVVAADKAGERLAAAAATALGSADPPIEAFILNSNGNPPSAEVWIWPSLGKSTGNPQRSGTVSVSLGGPGGQLVRTATFVDKSWVESFSGYLSTAPSPKHLMVAQSPLPAIGPDEAVAQALRDAAGKLARYLRVRLTERLPASWLSIHGHRIREPHLIPIVEAELSRGGFIVDRFVQTFHRPGGDVCRALLLIHADPQTIDRLAADYERQHLRHRTRVVSLGLSMLVLLGVITGLYLFLNAATKGYYTAALRLAVIATIALGLGFLVMLA